MSRCSIIAAWLSLSLMLLSQGGSRAATEEFARTTDLHSPHDASKRVALIAESYLESIALRNSASESSDRWLTGAFGAPVPELGLTSGSRFVVQSGWTFERSQSQNWRLPLRI